MVVFCRRRRILTALQLIQQSTQYFCTILNDSLSIECVLVSNDAIGTLSISEHEAKDDECF